MPASDLFKHFQYINDIERIAERHGMVLEVSSDFHAFRRFRATQPDRPPISPMFDPEVCTIDANNGFWIKGTNRQGEVVHVQAVRLEDLTDTTLAEHLHRHRAVYAPPGVEVDLEQSRFCATPSSRIISGKVCYHGELWLKGGPNGYRGHGMTAALPRLALALAHLSWRPDFMFGLVPPMAACKGLAAREGYMHLEPGGILWQRHGMPEIYDEWLVWMSHSDLQYLMRIPPMELYEQLEAKQKDSTAAVSRVQAAA